MDLEGGELAWVNGGSRPHESHSCLHHGAAEVYLIFFPLVREATAETYQQANQISTCTSCLQDGTVWFCFDKCVWKSAGCCKTVVGIHWEILKAYCWHCLGLCSKRYIVRRQRQREKGIVCGLFFRSVYILIANVLVVYLDQSYNSVPLLSSYVSNVLHLVYIVLTMEALSEHNWNICHRD